LFGKEVSRDVIGQLRALNFIAAGPRSLQAAAPYTYVTTKQLLSHFGFDGSSSAPAGLSGPADFVGPRGCGLPQLRYLLK
jgi:chromosome segregation and condensation protein ScpB